jgi:multidrug efflux pump subunit AcrA (membrane-fusion protein)
VVDEETILKIASIDPLRVDVLMPAGRYGAVKSGMRAAIEPEHPADASVVATVSVVDPIIDAASGTFGVQMDLPNPGGSIPGGLHCTVKFLEE